MNWRTFGFWDLFDESLQWIGKGVAWLLLRKHYTRDEDPLWAAIGGAFVCAVFGGIVGFALSKPSPELGAIGGSILGGLLGVCIGICFGVFVETVDSMIKDLARSLNSK